MTGESIRGRLQGATVAGVFLLALWMRLRDPLRTRMIAAEDPFTHIVITKELVERGFVAGSFSLSYPLYPPGLHALMGTLWTGSGIALYDLAKFAPSVLGALGAAGIALVLWREAGAVAGLTGGIITATMPEHIFRTNLLFPSALDLFLIPVFFHALLMLVRGERSAAVLLALSGAVLLVSHPWVMLLLVPVSLGFLVLRLAFPVEGQRVRLQEAALAAVIALVLAMAAHLWWGDARFIGLGKFFQKLMVDPIVTTLAWAIPIAVAGAAVAWWWLRNAPRARQALSMLIGMAAATGAASVVAVMRAQDALPLDVDHLVMLGAPAAALGVAGIVVAFARRSAVGDLGLATVMVTFPFGLFNPFGSEYWPQRSIAYLTVGVVLLAGLAAAELARRFRALGERVHWRAPSSAASFGVVLIILLASVPVGQSAYEWGRYYTEDEWKTMEAVGARLDDDPDAVVLVGTWQPNLFLRGISDHHRVVWAKSSFSDAERRESLLDRLDEEGKEIYLLVDHYTLDALDLDATDPLPGVRLDHVEACCEGRIVLYRVRAG